MKNLSFAFNTIGSLNSLAVVLDQEITPKIYERTKSISIPFFVGFILILFSAFCAAMLITFEYKAEKLDKNKSEDKDEDEKVSIKDFKIFSKTYWLLLLHIMISS